MEHQGPPIQMLSASDPHPGRVRPPRASRDESEPSRLVECFRPSPAPVETSREGSQWRPVEASTEGSDSETGFSNRAQEMGDTLGPIWGKDDGYLWLVTQ